MKKLKSLQDSMQRMVVAQVADILATGVMRLHLRDVRNILKKNRKTEISLEVSFGQSVHPVEPEHEGERH